MPATPDGVPLTVVTVSDRAFAGTREDATGPMLRTAFEANGAIVSSSVVPDDVSSIADALATALAGGARAVVTTGGTGVSPRDVTPEATAPFIAKDLPGIPELLRAKDAVKTVTVALSRGRAGLTNGTPPALIVNLPGSVRAVESALEVLPGLITHVIDQTAGGDH